MLKDDMLQKPEIKHAMRAFEYNTIYQKTMSVAICNLLSTKGFKNTKSIDAGGFGMVYSAKNEDGR